MNEFVCGYWIKFRDDGDPELQILHRGAESACRVVLALLPGVAYSGARPVDEAGTFLIPTAEWDAAIAVGP